MKLNKRRKTIIFVVLILSIGLWHVEGLKSSQKKESIQGLIQKAYVDLENKDLTQIKNREKSIIAKKLNRIHRITHGEDIPESYYLNPTDSEVKNL